VLTVVILLIGASALFGPMLGWDPESHAKLLAGLGVASSVLLAAMRAMFGDDDGDGKPNYRDDSISPPAPRTGAAAKRTTLLLGVLTFALSGCGASTLQRSATAASISSSLLKGSRATLEVVCATDRVERADAPAQRARRCLASYDSYEVAVAAWVTWTTALLAVADDDEALEATQRLAGPVLRFLAEVAEMLRAAGADVPEVPAWLLAFADGGAQ
jgi:hypothetical protein